MLKLKQGQIWKQGDDFIRVVHLERLEVGYKVTKTPRGGEGTHHKLTKKLFCRLIKNAELVDPAAHYGSGRPEPATGATTDPAPTAP